MSSKPRHVYLVDGSGYIFRAYHALPPLTRSDGTPISAVLGYSNMLAKLLQETDADHLAVVFDRAKTSFRHRIYEGYKAQRPAPPSDLVPQFKLVRAATDAFNVCAIEREDYEADDLIATYARRAAAAGATVTIVSSDKDLMQLVGNGISMLDPIKQRPIGEAEVREKFGVGPAKVADVQALCGDSIDNVPGVKGISGDAAAQLIEEFGDLESLLTRASDRERFKQEAQAEAKKVEERIFAIVGHPFNLASAKQLGEVLFSELGLLGGVKGKTGNFSVGADALSALAKTDGGREIASLIARWRLLTKVHTTFADLLAEHAEQARLAKRLVLLKDDVPLPVPLEALAVKPLSREKIIPFLREQEFKALLTRIEARLSDALAPRLNL